MNDVYTLAGDASGIVVTTATGPAAKAGIVPGELITAVNGSQVTSVTDLQAILARLMPGNHVTIAVTSASGQKRTVPAVLADLAQI